MGPTPISKRIGEPESEAPLAEVTAVAASATSTRAFEPAVWGQEVEAFASVEPRQERVIVLEPDFEAVAGLRGHGHKPERAWREFAERAAADMPGELVAAAERTISFVRAYAEAR